MAKKKLVIVESPAKAKTIEKILGSSYEVTASFGHVRDLPKTTIGVKIDENFKPSYSVVKDKKEIVAKLKEMAKNASKVYLASDPDREGEAIAWHVATALKLDLGEANRIEFNEITESAVGDSIKQARTIDMKMVNAQQARRILDRIVGYKISPLLWRTVEANTSAGRVQSVALKMICDLEDEIRAFIPEKFWNVAGDFESKLKLTLNKVDGKKFELLTDEKIVKELEQLKKGETFTVTTSNVSPRTKNPPLPLKTSTLQQLSSSYIGFSASKTMRVAQGLYESGYITYMRTDSTRLSDEAKEMAAKFIKENYGKEYIGAQKEAKNKQKIQDAHEAVRPTSPMSPEMLRKKLDADQEKLYKLIWDRFILSQMSPVKYEQFEVVLSLGRFDFRGSLNKIIFDGYYKLFKDEDELPLGDFPNIKVGDKKKLEKLDIAEDYTKPPARITESSLVKKLEQEGIGRPSTYATIVDTLKKRVYVELQGKSFVPTKLGYEVKQELEKHFPSIMNIKFTAELEDELDKIAEGKLEWTKVLQEFYDELDKYLKIYGEMLAKEQARRIESDVVCDCNGSLYVMKTGIFGKYLVCENPDCKKNISLRGIEVSKEQIAEGKIYVKDQLEKRIKERQGKPTDVFTEKGARCLLKLGRFGSYLESENYKEDEIRVSLPNEIKKQIITGTLQEKDGISLINGELERLKKEEEDILKKAPKCELCGKDFRVMRGRWGKYLSCSGYPECKNIKKLDKDGNITEATGSRGRKSSTKFSETNTKKTTTKKTVAKKVTAKKTVAKKTATKK
ncbi:MAG: type I DNA topoisomerase [Fusobacteriaceae bacterium]